MSRVIKAPNVRKRELMDIGFNLYMEKGMSGLNIKEIVDKAGVATGLFYYYFKSKEKFVIEAIKNFAANNIKPVVDSLKIKGSALLKLNTSIAAFQQCVNRALPYCSHEACQSEQQLAFIKELLAQLQPIVEKIIIDGNNEGVFLVKKPKMVATYILYGLWGIMNTQNDHENETIQELVCTSLGINKILA